MSRFLAPEMLQERGIAHFDGWAAVFGDIVDTVELSPDAQSLRQNRRFARFVNLPELLQIFHSFADVKTADMLDLPCPTLKGDKAEIVATPMTDYQKRIQQSLVDRYEKVRGGNVDPRDDNALKITTDGRKLALDERLVLPHLPQSQGKIDAVVENVFAIWQQSASDKATQLLFCDMGVSSKDGRFSAYDAITAKLTQRGVPACEIAAMGDYGTDAKKALLFTKVRNGDVRILLGSTQKMGVGTNVQDRLIALHHIDAPWKPAEVEQREGRILRQGNMHEEVQIYRYVTEGSFDAYMWQTLQTKAEFINQIMKGDMTIRRIEDMDDQTLSYAEVKAIASGNPAVLTLAKMDMEVQRLSRLARAHQNEQYQIRRAIRTDQETTLPNLQRQQERLAADLEAIEANGGLDAPELIVNRKHLVGSEIASETLRAVVEERWNALALRLENQPSGAQLQAGLGTYGGLTVLLTLEKGNRISGRLNLDGQTRRSQPLRGPGSDKLPTYLYQLIESIPEAQQETATDQAALEAHIANLQNRLGLPFEDKNKLLQLIELRDALQGLLQMDKVAEHIEDKGMTPEEVQESVNATVVTFDKLMKIEKQPKISHVDKRGPEVWNAAAGNSKQHLRVAATTSF